MFLNASLKEISQIIHGEIKGSPDTQIHQLLPLHQSAPGDLSFISSPKYLQAAQETKASALIVSKNLNVFFPEMILVDDAHLAVTILCQHFFSEKFPLSKNIHPSVQIGPNVVLEEGVIIQENTCIGANCFVGANSTIGANTTLFPNITIYPNTVVGNNVLIHSGCVIGADGFGYHHQNQQWQKIPQVGYVHIDDEVEIGANTCIDRARLGKTYIGKRTKIDNLVQIGHGCVIGEDCLICGCTGIAGSVHIGDRVTIASQCGIADHIEIASETILAGRTGVYRDIKEKGMYWGIGPQNKDDEKESLQIYRMLPELYKRVLCLEKKSNANNN